MRKRKIIYALIVVILFTFNIGCTNLSNNKSSNSNETIQTNKVEQIVYVTKSGSKYHRAGCKYLSKSQIAMNKSEAIDSGYTACSVCNP